jgi:hypothetical protein
MNKNKPEVSRRDFFQSFLKDTIRLSLEIKENCQEGMRTADVLAAFEDYPIAQTYPRELFEEEAQRLGIDIDKVGETEAIRRIIAKQMDHGKA